MNPVSKRTKNPPKRSKTGCKEGHCGCRKGANGAKACTDSCGCYALKNCTNVFGRSSTDKKRERSSDESNSNNNVQILQRFPFNCFRYNTVEPEKNLAGTAILMLHKKASTLLEREQVDPLY